MVLGVKVFLRVVFSNSNKVKVSSFYYNKTEIYCVISIFNR